MKFELSHVASHIRIYNDDSKSGANRDPYDAIVTIQYLNDDVVYLSGMNGKITRQTLDALIDFLRDTGAKRVIYDRRGQKKTIDL